MQIPSPSFWEPRMLFGEVMAVLEEGVDILPGVGIGSGKEVTVKKTFPWVITNSYDPISGNWWGQVGTVTGHINHFHVEAIEEYVFGELIFPVTAEQWFLPRKYSTRSVVWDYEVSLGESVSGGYTQVYGPDGVMTTTGEMFGEPEGFYPVSDVLSKAIYQENFDDPPPYYTTHTMGTATLSGLLTIEAARSMANLFFDVPVGDRRTPTYGGAGLPVFPSALAWTMEDDCAGSARAGDVRFRVYNQGAALAGATLMVEMELAENFPVAVFKEDAGGSVAGWSEVSSSVELQMEIPAAARFKDAFGTFGGPEVMETVDALVGIPSYPAYGPFFGLAGSQAQRSMCRLVSLDGQRYKLEVVYGAESLVFEMGATPRFVSPWVMDADKPSGFPSGWKLWLWDVSGVPASWVEVRRPDGGDLIKADVLGAEEDFFPPVFGGARVFFEEVGRSGAVWGIPGFVDSATRFQKAVTTVSKVLSGGGSPHVGSLASGEMAMSGSFFWPEALVGPVLSRDSQEAVVMGVSYVPEKSWVSANAVQFGPVKSPGRPASEWVYGAGDFVNFLDEMHVGGSLVSSSNISKEFFSAGSVNEGGYAVCRDLVPLAGGDSGVIGSEVYSLALSADGVDAVSEFLSLEAPSAGRHLRVRRVWLG